MEPTDDDSSIQSRQPDEDIEMQNRELADKHVNTQGDPSVQSPVEQAKRLIPDEYNVGKYSDNK